MKTSKPIIYFILFLGVLCFSGGLAFAKHGHGKMKHKGMDYDYDGIVERDEWRGNEKSFRKHDKNHDGILSGKEVRPGAKQKVVVIDRFIRLDDNSNGYVSRGEWVYAGRSFEALDRNHDGRLSRNEFYDRAWSPGAVFLEFDTNDDGRISLREWRGERDTFYRLDVSRDRYLTESEFYARQTLSLVDLIFREIFR